MSGTALRSGACKLLEKHPLPRGYNAVRQLQNARCNAPAGPTGTDDGSLQAWSLDAETFGQWLFCLRPHGGAVTLLQAPPADAAAPWAACVVSAGADGTVCIVSLLSGSCERVLLGNTGMLFQCSTSASTLSTASAQL